jgi:thiol-disulfide isomerase/thioredoxin
MVDWDRVSELRANGVDWEEIARDEKVGYRPDASVTNPGRALRALYHREKAREARQGPTPAPKKRPIAERQVKWTLLRAGYLLVPAVAIWFVLAFVAPSPIGLLVPAIPYLALALAVVAGLLLYTLWRSRTRRWTNIYRNTVIVGVIIGLIFAGLVGIVGSLVYGCPYLPPPSAVGSVSSSGWHGGGNLPKWESGGKPVLYYYGTTWCPYCSASSWALWKALVMFGSLSGAQFTDYSSSTDVFPSTPEVDFANAQLSNSPIDFQVSEYAGGVDGVAPTTSSCFQLAYVTAYSGGSIPFYVIGGQYVHGGSTLIDPSLLKNWSAGANGGDATVKSSVQSESGPAWGAVQVQAWWMMAMLAKSCGEPIPQLTSTYHWNSTTVTQVTADYGQL